MSNTESSCPIYSSCFPYEEQGEWVWVPKAHPIPTPHQSPDHSMYRSFSESGSECGPAMPWAPPPVSPAESFATGSVTASPVETLLEDFDVDMALQLNAALGETSQSWSVPPSDNASMDLFTNCLDADLFPGVAFGLVSPGHLTPPENVSPATSVHTFHCSPIPVSDHSIPPASSLPALPAAATAAATTTTQHQQQQQQPSPLLRCTHPDCPYLSTSRSDLRKHERRAHRQPFRCPLPGCAKGHADQRALSRHLWAKHPAYAAAHDTPSERARCGWPGCGYVGRGDNVARHARRHLRGGCSVSSVCM